MYMLINSLVHVTVLLSDLNTYKSIILLTQCYYHRGVDTPSPEGRAKSLGEDDVERIVLTA